MMRKEMVTVSAGRCRGNQTADKKMYLSYQGEPIYWVGRFKGHARGVERGMTKLK